MNDVANIHLSIILHIYDSYGQTIRARYHLLRYKICTAHLSIFSCAPLSARTETRERDIRSSGTVWFTDKSTY
jgi:hypothetical protein